MQKAPHHLVGSVPMTEEMSAEKFRVLASTAIEEINRRGRLAIVVGGSGLYVKALTHGLAPLPAINPKLRAELNALSLEELNAAPGGGRSVRRKEDRSAEQAARRQGAGDFHADRRAGFPPASQWNHAPQHAVGVLLLRDRVELYSRIDRRVEEMFLHGVTKEVAAIGEIGPTAAKALGFRPNPRSVGGKNQVPPNAWRRFSRQPAAMPKDS